MFRRVLLLLFFITSKLTFSQSYLDFYFKSKDIDGAILIYDEKNDSWIFNYEKDIRKKTPIGSLFNLPNALIVLDLGIISTDSGQIMAWDGVKRYHFGLAKTSWNCNTNLDEALDYKTDWYFQNISKLVKPSDYQYFLKRLNLTNINYKNKISYYWHFGGLETTPQQQISFLKKLNKRELFFQKESQQYLYDKMLLVENEKYTIHGYETFNVFEGKRIDWWIGVLKTKDNTYYFSTRIYEDINREEKKDFMNFKFQTTIEIFSILGYI